MRAHNAWPPRTPPSEAPPSGGPESGTVPDEGAGVLADVDLPVAGFAIPGELVATAHFGSGHIHATFVAEFNANAETSRYVFQRLNERVFPDIAAVMDNLVRVLAHLDAKERPGARRLSLVPTTAGSSYHRDPDGHAWRAFPFLEGTESLDSIESPGDAFEAARAFGAFASDLADLPGPPLSVPIPHFHDLAQRFGDLQRAAAKNISRRAERVSTEIDRLRRWFDTVDAELLACDLDGQPRRIAHHDCKVNNVLFDRESRDAVCVVDLDTVMEGTLLSDFGELVRTAACPSPEDEIYRAGMHLDVEVLRALSHGYLMGAAPLVTDAELQVLPLAGLTLALMNAIRFLTDDLEGDRYFHVDREGHNLDRCRAQLRLVELLHEHREATREILREAAGELGLPR